MRRRTNTATTSRETPDRRSHQRIVRHRLGWGLFCGVYWGDQMKNWQFEGLRSTKQEAHNIRTAHCLSREVRPIYASTKVNIVHHSSPRFVRGDSLLEHLQRVCRLEEIVRFALPGMDFLPHSASRRP